MGFWSKLFGKKSNVNEGSTIEEDAEFVAMMSELKDKPDWNTFLKQYQNEFRQTKLAVSGGGRNLHGHVQAYIRNANDYLGEARFKKFLEKGDTKSVFYYLGSSLGIFMGVVYSYVAALKVIGIEGEKEYFSDNFKATMGQTAKLINKRLRQAGIRSDNKKIGQLIDILIRKNVRGRNRISQVQINLLFELGKLFR